MNNHIFVKTAAAPDPAAVNGEKTPGGFEQDVQRPAGAATWAQTTGSDFFRAFVASFCAMGFLMDRRVTPYRDDIAADWLEGQVEAGAFVAGVDMQVAVPVADVRRRPEADSPIDTQAILGDFVTVYETTCEGWAWGQLKSDGYVGYIPASALSQEISQPTHWICSRWSFHLSRARYEDPAGGADPVRRAGPR